MPPLRRCGILPHPVGGAFRAHHGSVLAEFLIVLPIYMFVLGFAFVTGELALQSIRIAGGGDRLYAMTKSETNDKWPAAFRFFKNAIAPHDARDVADGGNWDSPDAGTLTWHDAAEHSYSYEGDPDGGTAKVSDFDHSDTKYTFGGGVWTEATAARVVDRYTLTPFTRSLVSFWRRQSERQVKEMGGETDVGGDDSALDDIFDETTGRTKIFSKDLHKRDSATTFAREYGYYSLRRNEGQRELATSGSDGRYRSWSAGYFAARWSTTVAADKVAPSSYEDIERGGSWEGLPLGSDPKPSLPDKQFDDAWTR